ncbi:uncharacterized protein LOC121991513 [Zingiber officinale]|uniref:uncharacterized protein LOC121991513 n=1 Tax=Zingiber officinale TaxID=94328 RepID=UPI001C4B15D3|nr:uncharacterized protein LOC121991513 [Zingiber officinale]
MEVAGEYLNRFAGNKTGGGVGGRQEVEDGRPQATRAALEGSSLTGWITIRTWGSTEPPKLLTSVTHAVLRSESEAFYTRSVCCIWSGLASFFLLFHRICKVGLRFDSPKAPLFCTFSVLEKSNLVRGSSVLFPMKNPVVPPNYAFVCASLAPAIFAIQKSTHFHINDRRPHNLMIALDKFLNATRECFNKFKFNKELMNESFMLL